MSNKNELSESLEDYLETILDLQEAHKVARSKDISEKMGVQRGSVTGMLKNLAERGLINYEPYGYVTLTVEGEEYAREIKRRHVIIKDFLIRVLQVEDAKADLTACRMEHVMDESTVDMLAKFIVFLDGCPRVGSELLQVFTNHCSKTKSTKAKCQKCNKKSLSKA